MLPQTLDAIRDVTAGACAGQGGRLFLGVAPLSLAGPDQVSFCEGRAHAAALGLSRAGLVLVSAELALLVPPGGIAMICQSPALAFARVAALFHPTPRPNGTVHASAVIDASARIGQGSEIGPFVVIEADAQIGRHCRIAAFAMIGAGVVMGDDCVIHSHCSVTRAVMGHRVTLHPGARIGQEGFGFVTTQDGEHVTAPQLGIVRLGDGVEIGANACVDRSSLGETVLGPGTRLDNLVQVGHNVRTGRGCVLVAQVGIAGSTTLGDFVVAGGQSGFAGHLTIGQGARIAAQAGVMHDVPPGVEMLGSPASPKKEALRALLVLKRLGSESRSLTRMKPE